MPHAKVRSNFIWPAVTLLLSITLAGACEDAVTTSIPGLSPSNVSAAYEGEYFAVTGGLTDPPLVALVTAASGRPLEGVPVRFVRTQGEGLIETGVAVTGPNGVAQAAFRAGPTPGLAEITVDIPSAPAVVPLVLPVRIEPADSVVLTIVSGAEQSAETASELPLPLVVAAETVYGSPAGGVAIRFRIAPREQDPESETAAGAVSNGDPGEAEDAGDEPIFIAPSLTRGTGLTGSDGQARTVLRLGSETGQIVVEAFAEGVSASDTVRIPAIVLPLFVGSVRLDSVRASRLPAGGQTVLFGSGFSPIASDNRVWIGGRQAAVLGASPRDLLIRVPAFEGGCEPARSVGVRVINGGELSNGEFALLEPVETPVDLEVGQSATLAGEAAACLQISASANARQFLIAVGNTSLADGEDVAYNLSALPGAARAPGDGLPHAVAATGTAAAGETAPDASRRIERLSETLSAEAARALLHYDPGNAVLRRMAVDELLRRRASPARPRDEGLSGDPADRDLPGEPAAGSRVAGGSTAASNSLFRPPLPGDTLRHFFPVGPGPSINCEAAVAPVRSVVRWAGRNIILAEDTAALTTSPSPEQWTALGNELDNTALPAVMAYFGEPGDLDGNRRVVLLFTPRVNRLATNEWRPEGFFLPLDLAAARPVASVDGEDESEGVQLCPAGNEAEIIYVRSPDPRGADGPVWSVEDALQASRRVAAHELQHLISTGRRLSAPGGGFGVLDETWLEEALSAVAQEAAGRAVLGLRPGTTGLDLSSAPAPALATFDAYLRPLFAQVGAYLADPGAGRGGEEIPVGVDALGPRGFGWLTVRWMADIVGGDERVLFRSLALGGQRLTRGVANLERVSNRTWAELMGGLAASLAGLSEPANPEDSVPNRPFSRPSDPGPEGVPAPTWDLPGVFEQLEPRLGEAVLGFGASYPLRPSPVTLEASAWHFDVHPSGAAFFRLALEPESPALALSVGIDETGTPAGLDRTQITITRIR